MSCAVEEDEVMEEADDQGITHIVPKQPERYSSSFTAINRQNQPHFNDPSIHGSTSNFSCSRETSARSSSRSPHLLKKDITTVVSGDHKSTSRPSSSPPELAKERDYQLERPPSTEAYGHSSRKTDDKAPTVGAGSQQDEIALEVLLGTDYTNQFPDASSPNDVRNLIHGQKKSSLTTPDGQYRPCDTSMILSNQALLPSHEACTTQNRRDLFFHPGLLLRSKLAPLQHHNF